ncbi:hypothetical protein PCASD_01219 [Puccinia coronata f. sp. avenae]|uniref:Uncharacterized protein n=1 Tax=Puccinia coronata f. sp. avenae TaxID=200324 RepID=A0A2N5VLU6_9BASI|nr:hypothetical protein PCASD_01219 [Puccinia coronata f. sp. avenae]
MASHSIQAVSLKTKAAASLATAASVAKMASLCNPSVPKPENNYGTDGNCGTVRYPNKPNGAPPGGNPGGTHNGYDYTNDNPDGTTIIYNPNNEDPDGTSNNWDLINTNL